MGLRSLFLYLTVAATLTVVLYGATVGYGFYYDDYHFVRPYSADEVLAAFRGPWDASGIELPYFRPLTISLFAFRFLVLGINAPAYHVLSLALFAATATAFGVFAARVLDSRVAGTAAVVFFTVHPGMPYAAVAWITNQMHLAALLTHLAALLWWFHVRRRPAIGWWIPLLLLAAVAFLIKEDGLMLIPAVLALHLLRKGLVERDLPLPIPFLAAAAVLIAGLLLWRAGALAGHPQPHVPSFDQGLANLKRGFSGPFALVPARRPFQLTASWFATVLPLIALLTWTRLTPSLRFGIIGGAVIGALFDLPFAFLVKAEQLHNVSAAACLTFAASAAGLVAAVRPHALKVLVAGTVAAGALAMALVARNIAADFVPLGPVVIRADRIVQEWAAVPVELREYLGTKAARDGAAIANPAAALDLVAFGLYGLETDPTGRSLRWMAGTTVHVLISPRIRLLTIPYRHEIGAFREPARLRVVADGRSVESVTISDGAWHATNIVLRPGEASRLAGMHRVSIQIDRVWVPAQIIPGSNDSRPLGLQIGAIESR